MARIIAGMNSAKLSKKVSDLTGLGMIAKETRRFPDGELYVRLGETELNGEKVFVIAGLYPEPNRSVMELMLTLDALRDYGAECYVIIPYMAYARQDKRFKEGEAFSLHTLARMLGSMNVRKIITIDAHFRRCAGDFDLFGMPALNITAADLLVQHGKKKARDVMIVGPDEGSHSFLKGIDARFLSKEKTFTGSGKDIRYTIKVTVPPGIGKGNVLLLDDIIGSGSTVIEASKELRRRGSRVMVGCTHGLFLGSPAKKLGPLAEHVFSTDTIQSGFSKVSVAPIIAEEIRNLI